MSSWSSNRSSAFNSAYIFPPSLHHFSSTFPYHFSLSLIMTVVIGSTPTSFLNSSLVFHGNTTHPSNHLHLHSFKLSPTTASKTSINHAASDTNGIHSSFVVFWMFEMQKALGTSSNHF